MSGLNITISNGLNLPNIEKFGIIDPYVSIEYQGQKKKTKVIEDNLNPQWDETLGFDLGGASISPSDTLIIKVMDKEKIGPDKLLGTVEVPLNELAAGKTELKLNLNLMDKNKRPTTGFLNMIIQYQGAKKVNAELGSNSVATTGGSIAGGNENEGGEEEVDEVDSGNPSGTAAVTKKIKIVGKRAGHKTYSTKPQDFQVRVKIIEARQLQGGNISPVCKIKCKNQIKQTKVKSSTSNPFWDSIFFLNFHLSTAELLDEIITFEIFNSRKLRSNALIGSFKFDLSMIYEEPKHALLNKWLLLSDPNVSNSGTKGYLKISIALLGPGDEAPSFTTPIQQDSNDIESNIIRPAGMQLRSATFILKVYQAEDLPTMDSAALQGIKNLFTSSSSSKELVDPYLIYSFAGKEIKTSTKFTCNHPEWNEELKIGFQFPSMCDRIKLQIIDWDRVGNNDAIGTAIINISSIGSMKEDNGYLPTFGPSYLNLYGGPREFSNFSDKFEALNLGKGDGVAYRGRVLLELTTQFNESPESVEPLINLSEDQILRVSKFLRRRKYHLHTVFMEANLIQEFDEPIEFEVSIGNYGNKFDDSIAASSSSTQPTNAIFDGSHYYFLPWGNEKPCCLIECHWEDISCRLYSINYFLRIVDRLTKNMEKIKVAIAANIPEEEQAQFVINAFDDLIMSCSKPLPNWEPGQSPETELDICLKTLRIQELEQIKTDAMFTRENATSVVIALHELEGFASQLINLSDEPQNSMPDIMIWLISGGKRKYYARIPAYDLIWSNDEDYRGRFCGLLQTISLKIPILLDEKDIKDLMIPCQLRVKLWIGQEKEVNFWHSLQKEGTLSVMAETYENQASLLGKWTTKSPMMTRPAWSDASGKIKLLKEKINPPSGWNWDSDWFISPEISLYYDKDALLTEYLEDFFICEMRISGGNWGPATTQYTDIKGDPCVSPNDIVLQEGWKWINEWKIDYNRPCDEEGWEYAVETSFGGFQPVEKMYHMCRRRRCVRERKLVTSKPKAVKGQKVVSDEDQHWEYATMFEFKFHSKEQKLDTVRRRRWHRKMVATKPGSSCFFNLGSEEEDKDKKQKTNMTAPRMYLKFEKSYKWQLRAYIYQARNLLAADQNGFSDPYARVVFCNQSQSTEIQMKSICPTWDQTLIFNKVEIHDDPITIRASPPKIIIELFDYDTLGTDEFLGRCEAYPLVKLQPNDSRRAVLQWFSIMKGSKSGGEILAAFEIYHIGEQELPVTPSRRGNLFIIPDGIRPMMQRTGLEIVTWGVRNMKKFQLVDVVSPEIELEIGGNLVQSSMIKNTKKNPNFKDPLKFIDLMLPKEELYMPPINIKVRDHRPFGRKPIVGTCCIKSTDKFRRLALDLAYDPLDDYPELFGSITNRTAQLQHSNFDLESLFKGNKKASLQTIDEDIDWWTKYYASRGMTQKSQKYLQLGYDTIIIYNKELEFCENYKKFNDFSTTFFLTRGSNDECDEDDEEENVGEFKGTFIIYPLPEDKNEAMPYKYLETKLPTSEIVECIVRVYIIKAYDLQPEDPSGMADPYIEIRLGKEVLTSKEEYIPNSLTPEFGRMFELKASIPIFKDLKIIIMDYDLLTKDDVIGETVIDLENRYLTKFRAICGLPQSYCTSGINQWRDNQTPLSILTEFCTKNRLPTPEFDDDNSLKIGQKIFSIDEIEIKSEVTNPHLGPSEERLALHVLRKLPFVKEHIETRAIYNHLQPGIEQGKIELWVDIFPTNIGLPGAPFNIKPRFAKKFELRIIVKNTYDVILDETNLLGEKMSDIYVKGWINGIEEKQETDVHYRSLDGEGNFNWRFVFPFEYIPTENCMVVKKKDHFWSLDKTEQKLPCGIVLQIWDNDKFSADDFLGTIEMDLCQIPAPVKHKGSCKLEQLSQFGGKEVLNLFESKRTMGIWPVYNNESGKPELTGKLEIEMELLTEQEITLRPAARARDDPNANPHLDPPNRPATSFFWLTSPWKTFKFIIWKSMKYYLITGLVVILLVLLAILFVYAVPGLLARKMVNV